MVRWRAGFPPARSGAGDKKGDTSTGLVRAGDCHCSRGCGTPRSRLRWAAQIQDAGEPDRPRSIPMPTRKESRPGFTEARRIAQGAAAWRLLALLALLAVLAAAFPPVALAGGGDVPEQYLQQPIHFEPSQGLAGPDTRFLSRMPGLTVLLQEREATLLLERLPEDWIAGGGEGGNRKARRAMVRIRFPGAKTPEAITAEGPLPGVSNYFLGDNREGWRTGVPHYRAIRYKGLHPGVDLVFHGRQRRLEYDFVLAPGVDAGVAGFALDGASRLEIDDAGDLRVHTAAGALLFRRPVAYQAIDGNRREVACRYRIAGDRIGFELGEYDREQSLVIDPLLHFSSYLGGTGFDVANGIARDGNGNLYIAGQTASAGFVTSPGAWGPARASRSVGERPSWR